MTGDYTEYWTDGLGTAARLTAINRRNKERITQAGDRVVDAGRGELVPRVSISMKVGVIL